jgi:MbtH protein
MGAEQADATIYKVVVNHEEQYSIWPSHLRPPDGWRVEGRSGTQEEVQAYIRTVWTDMRPLSLRRRMDEQSGR